MRSQIAPTLQFSKPSTTLITTNKLPTASRKETSQQKRAKEYSNRQVSNEGTHANSKSHISFLPSMDPSFRRQQADTLVQEVSQPLAKRNDQSVKRGKGEGRISHEHRVSASATRSFFLKGTILDKGDLLLMKNPIIWILDVIACLRNARLIVSSRRTRCCYEKNKFGAARRFLRDDLRKWIRPFGERPVYETRRDRLRGNVKQWIL